MVLSLPETIQEKIDVSSEGPSLETSIFSCIVSGSERTFTFRVSLNTLPTLATLVRDIQVTIFYPLFHKKAQC